jgi:hypothetical protein
MRTWASRLVVVIAVVASIATSPKKWRIAAAPKVGMPVESAAGGSNGLLVTIESSGEPEVACALANGQPPRLLPSNGDTYLCPPGGSLASVVLIGRVKAGCCGGGDDPPKDQYVRVVKSELVPVWHASVEEVFEVSSDDGIAFTVDSPHASFVEATIDGSGDMQGITVSSYGDNFHRVDLAGGTGRDRRSATIRVRATVYGVCSKECAKPADEPLKIERQR